MAASNTQSSRASSATSCTMIAPAYTSSSSGWMAQRASGSSSESRCTSAATNGRRSGAVLLLPQGGPVHRPGHHRALLRFPAQPGPAVPARTASASVAAVRGEPSARACAPGHRYYTDVKQRYDANRAELSQARRIVRQAAHILTALGDDAFTATTVAHTPSSTVVTR